MAMLAGQLCSVSPQLSAVLPGGLGKSPDSKLLMAYNVMEKSRFMIDSAEIGSAFLLIAPIN